MEANYVQHEGYHDQNSRSLYSYPNRNYPQSRPRNRMLHPSQYSKLSKTSTEEMMREWMASQIEANEDIKNKVVELESLINQGLRNYQAIIEDLERQFEFLEKKIQRIKPLPYTIKPKSIQKLRKEYSNHHQSEIRMIR
nr:hypothetical protein [Tanacetum cinerariifolium]